MSVREANRVVRDATDHVASAVDPARELALLPEPTRMAVRQALDFDRRAARALTGLWAVVVVCVLTLQLIFPERLPTWYPVVIAACLAVFVTAAVTWRKRAALRQKLLSI